MPESSRRTDPAVVRALDLVRGVLDVAPAGLLTDFDGTLSPIVVDPSSARLAAGADASLAALASRLAVVAVITGRAPRDARRLIGVPGVLIVGNHGTEWLAPDADAPEPLPGADHARTAVAEALGRVSGLADVSVEDKGLSATVHYRASAAPSKARAAILAALQPPPPGIEVREGRMSVELRPVGLGDKGSAARAVIERHGLRGAVVLGDDVTDLDMFAAVAELRAAGRVAGAVIAVGGPDREVPPLVAAAADAVLPNPDDVATMLAGLAR